MERQARLTAADFDLNRVDGGEAFDLIIKWASLGEGEKPDLKEFRPLIWAAAPPGHKLGGADVLIGLNAIGAEINAAMGAGGDKDDPKA